MTRRREEDAEPTDLTHADMTVEQEDRGTLGHGSRAVERVG